MPGMLRSAHHQVLALVAFFCVAIGSLGIAVAVTGGTGHCPAAADAFGMSHQEARDRARTPGNDGH